MSTLLADSLIAAALGVILLLTRRYARRHPRIPEEDSEDSGISDPQPEHGDP